MRCRPSLRGVDPIAPIEPKRNYLLSVPAVLNLVYHEFRREISWSVLYYWRKQGRGPSFIRVHQRCVLYDADEVREFFFFYFAHRYNRRCEFLRSTERKAA